MNLTRNILSIHDFTQTKHYNMLITTENTLLIFANEDKFNGINWVALSKFICVAVQMRGVFGYLDESVKDPLVSVSLTSLTSASAATNNTISVQTSAKLVLLLPNETLWNSLSPFAME